MKPICRLLGLWTFLLGAAIARADFSTIFNVPPQTAPAAIGSDTQLNLAAGGSLPNDFNAGVNGGTTSNIEVNITGGTVGIRFNANAGSTVNVSGGNVGLRFRTQQGATANISGGTFGPNVTIERDSLLNITGGEFPFEVHALFRSAINVWGGDIAFFQAHDEAKTSFYGSQFFVDGVELTGLVPGEPVVIQVRDVPFAGTLADGSSFDFDLISEHPHDQTGADVDHFAHEAVLTATYVPAADFNWDFAVDGVDLAAWSAANGAADGGDADGDGDTDGADFLAWQRQVTPASAAAAVPEPGAMALGAAGGLAAVGAAARKRRRRPALAALVLACLVAEAPAEEPVTAIDVLLLPDATMIEHAQAANARLRANYPAGFALDATHHPHITLLQRYVRTKELDAVYAAVNRVLEKERPAGWRLEATGYYFLDFDDTGLAGIVIKPTPQLRRLQQEVIDAVAPHTAKDGTSAAYVTTAEAPTVNTPTLQYVKAFVPQRNGKNFNPHVTVGVGELEFVREMKSAPFAAFEFKVAGAAVYHLGNFGTAQKKLWQWKVSAANR